jgi:translation initiation factor 1
VSDDYNDVDSLNSINEFIRQIDKEKINIVISKAIRRFNKPTTVVRGLHNREDVKSITKELKRKIGTGGTYKEGQIILQGDHRESVRDLLIAKGLNKESIEIL